MAVEGKELETATELLREALEDPTATLRDEQARALNHLLDPVEKNVLFITRTGGGKSAAYFIATRLLRDRHLGAGPTIVLCPLLSLANDQVCVHECTAIFNRC
jgi:superfamily II DNA helicase RecQ